MTADTWWPDGRPEVGDELASDLAAASMPKLLAEVEAALHGENSMDTHGDEHRIDAACRDAIDHIRLYRRLGADPHWSVSLSLQVAAGAS